MNPSQVPGGLARSVVAEFDNRAACEAPDSPPVELGDTFSGATTRLLPARRPEPHRVDVGVEFAYTLYLSATIADLAEGENAGRLECEEIVEVLNPFEDAGLLTARGHSLLAWVREDHSD